MKIADDLQKILEEIPPRVRVVAVSKGQTVKAIRKVYDAGQRVFGENRVLEMAEKKPLLPKDIQWHYIGHLQRNKVGQVVPVASMIQSIDSLRLLREVNREGARINKIVNCLIQFHIATEETKFGLTWDEASDIFASGEHRGCNFINICGVMGMATLTDDMDVVRKEFRNLRKLYERLKSEYFLNDPDFSEVSMGMSGDFRIAIEEGSTMVRLGTIIFGERRY